MCPFYRVLGPGCHPAWTPFIIGGVGGAEGFTPFNALFHKHTQTHTHIHAHMCTCARAPPPPNALRAYSHTQPIGQSPVPGKLFLPPVYFLFPFLFVIALMWESGRGPGRGCCFWVEMPQEACSCLWLPSPGKAGSGGRGEWLCVQVLGCPG